MKKTIDQLARIASAGGGMRIDAKGKTVDQLARIAAAGSETQAKLVILNTEGLTIDQLARIAAAGKGCVFFDMTE